MAEEGHAIGIDLGTTNSCVAVWLNDHAEPIANDMGNRTTRSCVKFTDNDKIVGDEAFTQAGRNPANAIFDAKRLIGRRFGDNSVQEDMKYWPFKVIQGPADNPLIVVTHKNGEREYSPEDISVMVLAKMREIAVSYLRTAVKNAVIAVPSYFDESQRQATTEAAKLAGLNVLRLVDDSTAAAIAFCMGKSDLQKKRNLMIFDWGSGSLDVALLTIGQGHFDVKATSGDAHLGGEDLDNSIVKYCFEEFKREHNMDISTNNPKALRRLKTQCEQAKKALSHSSEVDIEVDALSRDIDFSTTFTREKFEELNSDIFNKCMEPVKKCLKDAKMDISNVDDVIIVGGSSRIPRVQELLQKLLEGKELSRSILPDEAVACGAAALAALVSGNVKGKSLDFILLDVVPFSLGTEVGEEDVMSVMIPRNTIFPTKKNKTFVTTHDNQRSVHCGVFRGESKFTKYNNYLGGFTIDGIRPAPKGAGEIDVCFSVDAKGVLTVSAVDKTTRQKKEISIDSNKRSSSLPAEVKITGQKKEVSRRERLQEESDYHKQLQQGELM